MTSAIGAITDPTRSAIPHPTLHRRIREELREEILAGTWGPRERMPSECALMAQYGVSRITVRQALSDLQSEHVIFKVPGKGSFVAAARPFQQLGRLQGFAEAMEPYGHETFNRLLDLSTVSAAEQVAQRLQVSVGEAVTQVQRVRFLNRQPVSVDDTWLLLRLGSKLRAEALSIRDIFLIIENDFATPLGHAELALDAVAADARVASLLGIAQGTPVLRIERLTHDASDRPIDYEHLYCRSDLFQYRLRLERR